MEAEWSQSRLSRSRRTAPRFEHAIDVLANQSAGLVAIITAHQELIVARLTVANVRNHSEGQRILLERLAGGSASYPTTAPARSVFCDSSRFCGWTTGKQRGYLLRHLRDQALIILGAALRIPFPTQHPQFAVRQAFLFGLVERGFGNQNALAFVPPARAAETHDYRRKRAILPSSAGECGIPAGKVDKFIEIGAAHAESALAVLKQHKSPFHSALLHSEHVDSRRMENTTKSRDSAIAMIGFLSALEEHA